jgi:hypothetical protein
MKYLVLLLYLTGCSHEFWFGDGQPVVYSPEAEDHYQRMFDLTTIYQMQRNDQLRDMNRKR